MVCRHCDDNAFRPHHARKLRLQKIAHLTTALANQADHDHIRLGASDHLTHQHGFTNARTSDDGDPLPPPGGQERIDRPHRSEEHPSELQSLMRTSYAVFCWKNKINTRSYHSSPITYPTQLPHTY